MILKILRLLLLLLTNGFCNPNNPTGTLIPGNALARLCRRHPQTRFVIDESYLAFVPTAKNETMITVDLDNVLVLHSLSKIYRLPGLRIGFLIASPTIITQFEPLMTPWRLNSLAQAAVAYICAHPLEIEQFVNETQRFIKIERNRFVSATQTNPALTVFPTHTSYHLIQLSRRLSAGEVCARFEAERILIRNCSNFFGLSDQYVRMALGYTEVNNHLIGVLAGLN